MLTYTKRINKTMHALRHSKTYTTISRLHLTYVLIVHFSKKTPLHRLESKINPIMSTLFNGTLGY